MTKAATSSALHARIARLLETPAAGGAVARELNHRYRLGADLCAALDTKRMRRMDSIAIDPLAQCHVSAEMLLPARARSH